MIGGQETLFHWVPVLSCFYWTLPPQGTSSLSLVLEIVYKNGAFKLVGA
jgi:hypothetical protein